MPLVHVRGGNLVVDTFDPEGPVDPGFGGGIGASRPDNSLPPGFPPIAGNLPSPPPGVWPPLTPTAPIQPAPPWVPPGTIWPPISGPGLKPPSGGHPDQGLPAQPGHPSGQPLPPPGGETLPVEPKTYWVIAGIPGVGWRYCAVDPSLVIGMPLPPTAAPK